MPRTSTARARLIESAGRLIHTSSYSAVSVDDVCAAADVRKGSFYYFFPSKRDLALAAVDERWARARANILEPAFAPDVPPLERIARFFHRAADNQSGSVVHGCPFGNLALEVSTQDDAIRERVGGVFHGYRAYFEAALREAAASGSIPDQDIRATAEAILACFQGAMLLAKTHNDPSIIDKLADRTRALVGAHEDPT